MGFIIILFGLLILLTGTIMVLKPDPLVELLRRYADDAGLHALAVLIRLILGLLLVVYADQSKYPIVFTLLGWLSLIAALVLGVMGRGRFSRLMAWSLDLVPRWGRFSGLLAVLLGGFLAYAVI